MIFLIDGVDRVGKTTLAEKIADFENLPIVHNATGLYGYEDDSHNWDRLFAFLQLIDSGAVKNAIFDRFHLTQYAYSVLDRNYIRENAEYFNRRVDDWLSRYVDPIITLIYVSPDDMRRVNREAGRDLTEHDHMIYEAVKRSKIGNRYMCDLQDIKNSDLEFILSDRCRVR